MNSFFFLALVGCFISNNVGFSTPLPEGEKEHAESDCGGTFSVYNATETSDGTCVCHINAPETIQCTTVSNPQTAAKIDQLHAEIALLSVRLDQHIAVVESQGSQLTTLTTTMMTTLETLERIESGNLVISRPEYEILRREIADMEALLLVLKHNQTTSVAVVEALEAELANITAVVNSLEKNEKADTARLLAEIEDLKQRLLDCQQDLDNDEILFDTWFQPGNQDTCRKIESASSSYTIGVNSVIQGTWFRDPVKNQDRVYVFTMANLRYYNYLDVYPTVTDFHDGGTPLELNLPERAEGTGMVAYNGSLFFHVSATKEIGKYDIDLQQITKVQLPSDTKTSNAGAYLCDTYSDIDFAVDESGLWVIYTRVSANGFILISKVDPETLALTETWTTSVHKRTVGNCFVMCQVLYCTNSYNTHSDQINYSFDTKTSDESFLYVTINSKYLSTYALSYNPYDQKLYGWDNGKQIVYELSFEENE